MAECGQGGEGWHGAGGPLGAALGSEESLVSLHPPHLIPSSLGRKPGWPCQHYGPIHSHPSLLRNSRG